MIFNYRMKSTALVHLEKICQNSSILREDASDIFTGFVNSLFSRAHNLKRKARG